LTDVYVSEASRKCQAADEEDRAWSVENTTIVLSAAGSLFARQTYMNDDLYISFCHHMILSIKMYDYFSTQFQREYFLEKYMVSVIGGMASRSLVSFDSNQFAHSLVIVLRSTVRWLIYFIDENEMSSESKFFTLFLF